MANMELIGGPTGGQISSAQSSITFSNIPQTYTDLVLKVSARTTFSSTSDFNIEPNGSSANLTGKRIYGTGTSVLSDSATWELTNGTDTTSNTFINTEVYFPNYASSNYKSFSSDGVMENNATFAYSYVMSHLWANNTPISSLTIRSGAGNFVAGSTFYLYGISNVTSTTKATGGIVSSDGTYNYHMFSFSGTFTPTQSLSADILVVGGGGSGGANIGGGGGAGGLRYFASESLTATGYTCTVGAGGPGPITTPSYQGSNGGTSQFGALTSAVGGGYGGGANDGSASGSGASSGGNRGSNGIGTAGSGQGNIGAGHTGINGAGGGGGFAGAGVQGTSTTGGTGGVGTATYQAFAYATGTGDKGYYAGGGGGSGFPFGSGGPFGFGGLGGGGDGMVGSDDIPRPGKQSTGGGGGGGFNNGTTNPVQYNNGGSGIIIIRYAI